MNNWLQWAFVANMFLNLTGLFAFIPGWTGLPLSVIGGGMLLINLAYLMTQSQIVSGFFRSGVIWSLMILFLIWPVFSAIMPMAKGHLLIREIILQIFYFTSILATAVLTLRIGFEGFRKFVLIGFLISIFGIWLQAAMPGLFGLIAVVSDSSGEEFAYGRIGGFFINPNVAARFVILLYIVLMMSARKLSILWILPFSVATFVAVMITASRSSLLIAVFAIAYVIVQRYGLPYIRGRMKLNFMRIICSFSAIILIAASFLFILINASNFVLNETNVGSGSTRASQRYELFANGIDGFIYVMKEEMLGRWYTVEPYAPAFEESWILGRGLAGSRIYMRQNFLELIPHNTIFVAWLDYGVFYIMFGFGCFFYVAFNRRMRMAEKHMGLFFMPLVFVVCIGIMFTYDGFLAQRGLYILIGGMLALFLAGKKWFDYNQHLASQPLFRFNKRHSRKLI